MIAFSFFWRNIYWYGIFYFISFILGYTFLFWVGRKNVFVKYSALQQTLTKRLDTLLIFILVGVIFWGRLGHILIYSLPYYLTHLSEILAVREWWMSFIGGGVGVIIALLIFRKKYLLSRKEFFLLFDAIFVMVPLGIFFGRVGNFLNQELYGIPFAQLAKTSEILQQIWPALQSIGIVHIYPKIDQTLRINTNLLAMIFEGILLFIVNFSLFLQQKKNQTFIAGKITATFLIRYSYVRFLLEYLRADSQLEFVGLFTKSQRVFVCSLTLGILLYFFIVKKGKKSE